MLHMKNRLFISILIVALTPTVSRADEPQTEEAGVLARTGLDEFMVTQTDEGGVGLSTTTNLSRFYLGGGYDLLAAGVGFGVSWKKKSKSRFPLEIGLYIAPQLVKTEGENNGGSTRVSALLHVTLLDGFGVGFGMDAWFDEGGVSPDGMEFSERAFFTLGYGLTNQTDPATK
jgi:hypothetical protein